MVSVCKTIYSPRRSPWITFAMKALLCSRNWNNTLNVRCDPLETSILARGCHIVVIFRKKPAFRRFLSVIHWIRTPVRCPLMLKKANLKFYPHTWWYQRAVHKKMSREGRISLIWQALSGELEQGLSGQSSYAGTDFKGPGLAPYIRAEGTTTWLLSQWHTSGIHLRLSTTWERILIGSPTHVLGAVAKKT